MGRLYLDATGNYSDPASTSYRYLRANNEWATPDSDHKFLDAAGEWTVPELVQIYGVKWEDFAHSSKGVRTGAAANFDDPDPAVGGIGGYSPFDSISPWCDMVPETRGNSNVMVPIKKFWYLWSGSGTNFSLQIANGPVKGFHVSPAHMDRGDGKGERDVIYIGRYYSIYPYGTMQSLPGVQPYTGETISEIRKKAKSGTFMMMDWATWFTYQMLYLVEFADWNSQKMISRGGGAYLSISNGSTDDMKYHTGTMEDSRDTITQEFQYRNIESPWGNVDCWVDGVYYADDGMYTTLNPAEFADTSGGKRVGKPVFGFGYVSALAISSTGGYQTIYPTALNGSDTTGTCDQWAVGNSSMPHVTVSAHSTVYQMGLFQTSRQSLNSRDNMRGSRLQELP